MNKTKMTREDLEAYRARWQAVEEIERQELQQMTAEERWRELKAIFNFAYNNGWIQSASEEELEPIRARWRRLKSS